MKHKNLTRSAGVLMSSLMLTTLVASSTLANSITVLADDTQSNLVVEEGETYTFSGNQFFDDVEIYGSVESSYPVICHFNSSDTIENGEVIGNVQFVSDYDEKIAIIHTNDVHGHIAVEPYVKGLADSMKSSGDYSLVLTVSAGDIYGGGEAVAGSYDGELIPAIMDKVYDVIAPGNNDFGSSNVAYTNLLLSSLYENSKTLFANVTAKSDMDLAAYAAAYTPVIGNELFDELYDKVTLNEDGSLNMSQLGLGTVAAGEYPYLRDAIFTSSKGTKVGLYGISTNGGAYETQLTAMGSIASAEACVEDLKEQGADVVVGVGHTGWIAEGSTETSSNDTNSWQLANSVENEDAFIDGHTHSIINDGEGVLVGDDKEYVNQAQCFGNCIGVCYLYLKDGNVIAKDGEVLTDMSGIAADSEVQELVDAANAKVKEDFGTAYATTEYFLNGARLSAKNAGGTVRGNETNLGDLMTDIILQASEEKLGEELDFVAYPGFWLRSSIEAGDITMESIQSVFANPTALNYVEYSATDVLAMVEKGLNLIYPGAEGTSFFQYSGVYVSYSYKENSNGSGVPVTIAIGNTLVYDANQGGILVDEDWSAKGIMTLTGGEIDNWEGSTDSFVCANKSEVQNLVADYLKNHVAGVDYKIFPNTIAPASRIVEWSENYSLTEAIKANEIAHTVVIDEKVEPTCTESGLTEGSHCSVCGEVLTAQEEIPAIGHRFTIWITIRPATHFWEGQKVRCCRNCGEKEYQTIPKLRCGFWGPGNGYQPIFPGGNGWDKGSNGINTGIGFGPIWKSWNMPRF